MQFLRRLTGSGHIHEEIGEIFTAHLASGRVLDLPAGEGVNARGLAAEGFHVECADLFPEKAAAAGLPCTKCDMTEPLPFASASFDGILHSEGIEHVDNQLALLHEFARILRPGGLLVVTTPNVLTLGARLSFLCSGHPRPRRWLVAESHGYWGGTKKADEHRYLGHVFLINAFQLRFYLQDAGLEVLQVRTARYSINSLILAPILFPLVWWGTTRMWKNRHYRAPEELRRAINREILSPSLLFGHKLIMLARKGT